MGARNVSAAFAMWARLPHGAFRLLVGMALQSLDAPSKEGRPARIYYGGEAAMVEVFGRSKRSMYDALSTLRKEGAVEVIDTGRHGHRAVYRLELDPLSAAAKGAKTRTHKPAKSRTDGCENSQVKGAGSRTPRNNEGGNQESREGDISPPAVVSPAPDAPVDNPEFDEMTTEQANRELIKRHGLEPALRLLDQHGATCPQCENPARHLLATTPTLRVLKGGAA